MTVLLNEAKPVQQVYTEPQQVEVAKGLKGKSNVRRNVRCKTRKTSQAGTK